MRFGAQDPSILSYLTPGGGTQIDYSGAPVRRRLAGRTAATRRRGDAHRTLFFPRGQWAPLHFCTTRVTGVVVVTDRELGRGRHRTSRGVGAAAAPGTSRRVVVVAGGEPNTTCAVLRGRAGAVQLAGGNAPLVGDQDGKKTTIQGT